ncbi:hypothetical protein [Archangium sp.]|jgi:hypothetical protein|uniref:hypothetical protein n=1 Tax=Archangium sp. TaxID=1872627 RepID=UPI002EDB3065
MHAQTQKERLQSAGQWWGTFLDEFRVVCPRCERTALVLPRQAGESGIFASRRVTCTHCGFSNPWEGQCVSMPWYADPMRDFYFRLPLRLQIHCGKHLLWAFNHRHLGFLEAFVQASLRERTRHSSYGWHNRGLTSRLPRWLKAAQHRAAILKAIETLRKRDLR